LNTQLTEKSIRFWQRWVKKRNRLGNPQTITRRNLYVLPTGFGWLYALVVLSIFLGAVNAQINTLFLMTFLLAVVGLVSAWEAHANLKNLSFKFLAVEDTEQGTPAKISIFIQANGKQRWDVEFQIASQTRTRIERIPPEGLQFIVPLETTARGYFILPPIVICTFYPFGLWRVWSYSYFDEKYYVYPKAVDAGFWPQSSMVQNIKPKHALGDEEFYDLKQVENPWLEPKLIHWKIAAKGQGWFLKINDSNEVHYWLFKLSDLPSLDIESRLQRLSFWLQMAEANNMIYGLELKSSKIEFARGREHLEHCLRQLALYQ
jgi:uncharacterized protein (DUF58 family)